jgi:Zn-dependent protease/CBS domain-containing protein
MSWSFSIGRLAGTDVRIHLTFFLLIAWFALSAGSRGGTTDAIVAVLFVLAVFACVLAHEFGHVLMAQRFGIKTRDVTLLPIGGVANIERMPEKPEQELAIALAGPAVNVVIATVLILAFGIDTDPQRLSASLTGSFSDFVNRLALVNVILVVFNMLPAFPMDGGRVLRALLSFRLDRSLATRIAASIGQAVAFGLGFLGLFGNPLLLFIALFVFLAASHESYAVEVSEATKGARLKQATITAFETLDTDATVGRAAQLLLSTSQKDFPVCDTDGRLQGVLTRDGIIRALSDAGPDERVVEVMIREVPTLNCRAPLSDAVASLGMGRQPLVGVIDDSGRVVGIVTSENISEYMMIHQASQQARPDQASDPTMRSQGRSVR